MTNARSRNGSDSSILNTLILLQYPESLANSSFHTENTAWEYDLANGQYEVTVSVGDASFIDSNHVINIEGQNMISGFVPQELFFDSSPATASRRFTTGTATVIVNDGRLTIDAIGGNNTKINYVNIVPLEDFVDVDV